MKKELSAEVQEWGKRIREAWAVVPLLKGECGGEPIER